METRYRGSSGTRRNDDLLPSSSIYSASERDKRGTRYKRREDEPPISLLVLVVAFMLASFFFVRYVDHKLPTPLKISDVSENPKSFIEERAHNDLKTLTAVGPRVSGSQENDVVTVDEILKILNEIKKTKFGVHNLEFEVQKASGSFQMGAEFKDGITQSYSNLRNVIARLSPAGKSKSSGSVLVNCHFDSVPGSPGVTDDMISCAVMLEVIRVLTRQSKPLLNSVVFLFNGGEENRLPASHGFLKGIEGNETGHRFSKNLKAFINLEGAGAGFREILFQSGPGNGWLLNAYKKVPYPSGNVIGEEIFQSGIIPSDTDFRIFRDFGKIPGLDMAFVKNGYVYHTKFDNLENVTPGSMQHEGGNVLSLVETLGNLDFTDINYSKEKMVFFDVFGAFMVVYSENLGRVLNVFVAVLVLVIAWLEARKNVPEMAWNVFSTIVAWIIGITFAAGFGIFLLIIGYASPFHSNGMSVFLIFGVPCVLGQIIGYGATLKGNEDSSWIAGKTTLALILLGTTLFSRMVFVLNLNICFGILGWYASRKTFSGSKRLIPYLVIGEAFPFLISLYLATSFIDVFIPILGRCGTEVVPNIFIPVLTALLLTIPGLTGIVPIFMLFKRTVLTFGSVMLALILIWILVIIGRNPYTNKTPMRLQIMEVDQTVFEKDFSIKSNDAGFWLYNVDPNTPRFLQELTKFAPVLEPREEIDALSCKELYCGLPYSYPIMKKIRRTHWIPKQNGLSMSHKRNVKMEITQDTFISPTVRRLNFEFSGPDHLTINLSPGKDYRLIKWSLADGVPISNGIVVNDRPTYFIMHSRGIEFKSLEVTLDFEWKKYPGQNFTRKKEDILVDVNFASFYLFGDMMESEELKDLIRRLPTWSYPVGWSAIMQVYSIPAL